MLGNINFFALLVTVTVLPMLSSCATYHNFVESYSDEGSEPIRFGIFEPLSGESAKNGELEREGFELANEMYPTAFGRPIKFVVADNKSDLDEARRAAKMLNDKSVSVVLGSYDSALSVVGGEVFAEKGIPAIAATNKNPVVTSASNRYCRTCPVDVSQGLAVAEYAAQKLRVMKVAVLRCRGDDYQESLAERFCTEYLSMAPSGAAVVCREVYKPGSDDFKEQISAITASGAEAVFVPVGETDAEQILAEVSALGSNAPSAVFLGTDDWRTETLLRSMKDSNLKLAFSAYYSEQTQPNKMSKKFLDSYHKKYGDEAVPDSAVALAFDAYLVALNAICEAGENAPVEDIAEKLFETENFPGASGDITFDKNGDPIRAIIMMTVRDGEFVAADEVIPSK